MAKQQNADPGSGRNDHEKEVARYEQELSSYLQERIKPGLNSGAIPLLARSIAKEVADWERPNGASEHGAKAADDRSAEADDKHSAEGEAPADFEADMHECQAELGEEWILSFSVQGDDGWLTAEKDDGTQRLEAQTASVLLEAVGLLNEGGRST